MKRSTLVIKATAAIAALAACSTASPQQAQPADKIVTSTSQEVLVDVVVRDKKGHPVTDLKQDDFTVFDNNEKKTIKTMRLVQGTEGVTNGARAPSILCGNSGLYRSSSRT